MVTIIDYALRKSKDGKQFVSLQLQGDLELVQSQETGRFYATVRKCSVSSTFDESTAQALIGTKLSGTIKRVQCEAYDYKIPETGELLTLTHAYTYVPDDKPATPVMQLVPKGMELTG